MVYAVYPEDSPKLRAALKKCGADEVMAEYVKQFKAKRGFDPVKAQAVYEAKVKKIEAGTAKWEELGPWPDTLDEELLRTIAKERFTDKPGVVIALEDNSHYPGEPPIRFGPLKNIRTSGNTASGVSTETEWVNEYGSGPKPEKVVKRDCETEFAFRKTKDGWLISSGLRGSIEPPPPWHPNKPPPPPSPPTRP